MPNIPGPDTCPTDIAETAEAYIMETLPRDGARHFEAHYITCSDCAAAVEEAAQYVRAMKVAARGDSVYTGSGIPTEILGQ